MAAARRDEGVGATGAKQRQGEGSQTESPQVVRAGRPRLCVDGRQQQSGGEGRGAAQAGECRLRRGTRPGQPAAGRATAACPLASSFLPRPSVNKELGGTPHRVRTARGCPRTGSSRRQ